MTLNFYTLGVLYLIYSFLGWVGETVVATFRGKRFANRGMAAGPFCFVDRKSTRLNSSHI